MVFKGSRTIPELIDRLNRQTRTGDVQPYLDFIFDNDLTTPDSVIGKCTKGFSILFTYCNGESFTGCIRSCKVLGLSEK